MYIQGSARPFQLLKSGSGVGEQLKCYWWRRPVAYLPTSWISELLADLLTNNSRTAHPHQTAPTHSARGQRGAGWGEPAKTTTTITTQSVVITGQPPEKIIYSCKLISTGLFLVTTAPLTSRGRHVGPMGSGQVGHRERIGVTVGYR